MVKNEAIIWKKSKNLLPLVKNVVVMAKPSRQSQKFLYQNNPNKNLLKVTKYLGTSKSSLEIILRKLQEGSGICPGAYLMIEIS